MVVRWQGKSVSRQNKSVYKLGAEGVNVMVIIRWERLQKLNSSHSTLFIQFPR
jgi:hypothetical protein